jgi:amidohydrolase
LGAAKLLAENKGFKGTVHFIFQPAEENEGGGGRMVAEGLLDRFPMKAIFGLHNFPMLPLGYFATRPGPMMAAFDIFDITVKGVGSHGAMPHLSCDPVLAAAQMIVQIQSIVSRNVDPGEAAVVSVTDIHGGSAYNIIPDQVRLRGTTRHYSPEIQNLIEKRLREITSGVAAAANVGVELTYERRYPAVVNSPEETDIALRVATRVAGVDRVIPDLPPLMGSEDFAFFLQKVPGNYIGLGCGDSRPGGMLHQSRYDFNDSLLPIGVAYWYSLIEALHHPTKKTSTA